MGQENNDVIEFAEKYADLSIKYADLASKYYDLREKYESDIKGNRVDGNVYRLSEWICRVEDIYIEIFKGQITKEEFRKKYIHVIENMFRNGLSPESAVINMLINNI